MSVIITDSIQFKTFTQNSAQFILKIKDFHEILPSRYKIKITDEIIVDDQSQQ